MDKEIEIHKEALFSNEDFNTIDAFKLFDVNNEGYITIESMINELRNNELQENIQDAEKLFMLFMRFDKDRDGKLNYLEFSKAITPRNISYVNNYSSHQRGR